MSITLDPPAGPWTVADIDAMPDAGLRVEIHEGRLKMMPPARQWHSEAIRRLAAALERSGHVVGMKVGVEAAADEMRVPDVGCFDGTPDHRLDRTYFSPDELALVLEVVCESSVDEDRYVKPRWYARQGIPEFWRVEEDVDTGEAMIYQFRLAYTDDGALRVG